MKNFKTKTSGASSRCVYNDYVGCFGPIHTSMNYMKLITTPVVRAKPKKHKCGAFSSYFQVVFCECHVAGG